jgi:hypothetical protein
VHYGPKPYEGRGARHFAPTEPVDQELIMAKGQKRGNREIRKPKANKPPVAGATPALSAKRMLAPINILKKKN